MDRKKGSHIHDKILLGKTKSLWGPPNALEQIPFFCGLSILITKLSPPRSLEYAALTDSVPTPGVSHAGRAWGQEEKGTTEDEMAGWHH